MKKKSRGKFIVIEGLDKSGKGTAIARLRKELPQVVYFREPGGTPIGERIRDFLLNDPNFQAQPMTEALLFYAARNENVATIIRPALERGEDVLADRFSDSSEVYQFRMNGCDNLLGKLYMLDDLIVSDCQPDLVIFMDVQPEEAIRRINADTRAGERNRFDAKPLEYHKKVRQAYLATLARRRHIIVDTNGRQGETTEQTIERVCLEVLGIVKDFLGIE